RSLTPGSGGSRPSEGVAKDGDLRARICAQDRHHIETTRHVPETAPHQIGLRRSKDPPLLLERDGFRRMTERGSPPALHFGKAAVSRILRDEIDLPCPRHEVAFEDLVAGRFEVTLRQTLPLLTEPAETFVAFLTLRESANLLE